MTLTRGHTNCLRAAVLGSGNIAADLVAKLQRTPNVECCLVAGRRNGSDGLAFARRLGLSTSTSGLAAVLEEAASFDLVFDTTSADAAKVNWPALRDAGLRTIDLTPSKQGVMCVPGLNIGDTTTSQNVSLVTCGGQATLPFIVDVTSHSATSYLEVVTTNASRSLGPASREYIDEYIATTEAAMSQFSGVAAVKAIHIVNPADPPMVMQNTIFAEVTHCDLGAISRAVDERARRVKTYIPGFEIVVGPVADGDRLLLTSRVAGAGDYLPTYAGNLDIITCAAVAVAEFWADAGTLSHSGTKAEVSA
jgi:acetaldehyde dehydrogenase (acetylating)